MKRIPVLPAHLGSDEATLEGGTLHYIRNVLRMTTGHEVELFDGQGRVAVCRLIAFEDSVARLQVLSARILERPKCAIDLFVAPPKGERWSYTLEKATELGVNAIHPIITERLITQFKKDRLDRQLGRWREIVTSAARQAKRGYTPTVLSPAALRELGPLAYDQILVAHPESEPLSAVETPDRVAIFVGPEGGFTETEMATLFELGGRALPLGPRILRVETAAVVSVALVQSWWGDL